MSDSTVAPATSGATTDTIASTVDTEPMDVTPASDTGATSDTPISPVRNDTVTSPLSPATPSAECEKVTFRVVFAKKTYEVEFGLDKTVLELKVHLFKLCGCPISSQKLMYKGLLLDGETLRQRKFKRNAKCLLVGATGEQLEEVAKLDKEKADLNSKAGPVSGGGVNDKNWIELPVHQKVLKKGKPSDATVAYRQLPGEPTEPLPTSPIMGLYTLAGKVRLTFKMDENILVIGTNERTEKVPMHSIHGVDSHPIEGYPEYHILAIQLGKTERSRQYIYWFPAQYVRSVKNLFNWL